MNLTYDTLIIIENPANVAHHAHGAVGLSDGNLHMRPCTKLGCSGDEVESRLLPPPGRTERM